MFPFRFPHGASQAVSSFFSQRYFGFGVGFRRRVFSFVIAAITRENGYTIEECTDDVLGGGEPP